LLSKKGVLITHGESKERGIGQKAAKAKEILCPAERSPVEAVPEIEIPLRKKGICVLTE